MNWTGCTEENLVLSIILLVRVNMFIRSKSWSFVQREVNVIKEKY